MINNKQTKPNNSMISAMMACLLITNLLPVIAHAGTIQTIVRFTAGVNMGMAVDLNRDGIITFDAIQSRIKNDAIVEANAANDKTHPKIPYRFWINNDFDVVSNFGAIRLDKTSCDDFNNFNAADDEYQQQCEQWDEDPNRLVNTLTNTTPENIMLKRIETYRDLEDFSPIDIKIDPEVDIANKFYWRLKAVGVNINLFTRYEDNQPPAEVHAYIFDTATTQQQTDMANGTTGHFTTLRDDKPYKLTQLVINKYFTEEGLGRFIFEGLTPCQASADNCYIELSLHNIEDDKVVEGAVSTVHLELHDIKDFYELVQPGPSAQASGQTYETDAEYREGEAEAFHAVYNNEPVAIARARKLNIYDNLFAATEINQDYILQVHGWRVRDAEKTHFSETSFKRLYWSGYKGQMGALHWPTGWFDKPAYEYGAGVLPYVLGNERNYDISEVVARRVGVSLATWLNAKQSSGANIHAVAHSMGNVIISEALRNGGPLSSFAAGQAAIDAGSFDSTAADMDHELQVPAFISCPIDFTFTDNVDPEAAWRCYNTDNLLPALVSTAYDMPPDLYRRDLIVRETNGDPQLDVNGNYTIRHGKTSADTMTAYTSTPGDEKYYFAGVGNIANIVNLFNIGDAALTAWEFNQLTKPDFAQGIPWNYSNSYLDELLTYWDTCSPCDAPPAEPLEATSSFSNGPTPVPYKQNTAFEIMAHVIPARSKPLGQSETSGEISDNPEMTGFTNSNQDHSAPYHGYYSEVTPSPAALTQQQRAAFWNAVLNRSIYPTNKSNLTGLKNNIENAN